MKRVCEGGCAKGGGKGLVYTTRPKHNQSRRYASYWNAFLSFLLFFAMAVTTFMYFQIFLNFPSECRVPYNCQIQNIYCIIPCA